MSSRFDPYADLIVVEAVLYGRSRSAQARLILDTGANLSVVRKDLLTFLGYDPDGSETRLQMTTGSGTETVSLIALERIEALEQEREAFQVIAHDLPPTAGVDGVLGLDFFRRRVLTLNFEFGEILLK